MATETISSIPAHVRPEQVVDVDIYTDPRLLAGPHAAYKAFQDAGPDIFYTPRNGGHWIITRYDLMSTILRDPEHFSSKELHIPRLNSPVQFIPLSLDPPDHARYRAVLLKHFDKKSIAAMADKLRLWADRLIDRVQARGHCDFAEELGAAYPVSIFMEMMGMPLERFEEFRGIVLEYFSNISSERRLQLQETIIGVMMDLREQRLKEPREDLISKLLAERVRGEPLTAEEFQSMGYLLFLGGLDTVANALTFAFYHLAGDPELQSRLASQPERLPDFVEESLRMYGVVHQPRIVKKQIELAGARFEVGDMVMCALPVAGRDDRKNPDPERFDIDRQDRQHIAFSIGAHTCIGNVLARAEMRTFTEAWLRRIPNFRMAPGAKLEWRGGSILALTHLPLEWNAGG
ncbi:cytochrome P450 [Steroidobacter agaridevorans]|uniref:Cytochrome P450 n=1 Tax=Steroidobacter agaridevorans TaxID=2695856 RepID=A0A829YF48_9GAMM|nr:cytochrome P450 [Steroidobacter agaridevorans]GFE82055.1 cytochrome P450 [Steroidobacter agaridevorans]